MKILFTWLCIMASCIPVTGQPPGIRFHISKPLCVYTFLQTMLQKNGTSSTFYKYIQTHTSPADTAALNRIIAGYATINFGHAEANRQYPEKRQMARNAEHRAIITIAAASDINELDAKMIRGLDNTEWLKLVQLMKQAEPLYDKIVWNDNKEAIYSQVQQMQKNAGKLDEVFLKVNTFYGSNWPAGRPFNVYIYPIPGKNGVSSATPHGNCLVLNMFTQETDYTNRQSVAIHEMCHVLYEVQPLALQNRLDSVFRESPSAYAPFAYNYIDEALATACGNAWAYQYLSGKADTGSWYNDDAINRYAHAIYPLTERYINENRQIDDVFITQAIEAFEKEFPDAIYNYDNLVMYNHFYTDAASHEEFTAITTQLNSYFHITSSNGSYPILHEQSLNAVKTSAGTQWFIIHTKNEENLDGLKKIFPELKNADPSKEMITSFLDKNKRAVIIINIKGRSHLANALQLMKREKKITDERVRMIE